MKSKVAVIRCESYDKEEVREALRRGVDLLGGIDRFFEPDEKILLKPNFLTAKAPEAAVTTHPAVFEGIVDLLQEKGYTRLSYGDSPGAGNSRQAAKVCGYQDIAESKGVSLAEFEKGEDVPFHEGSVTKRLNISKGVLDADAVLSLSKMKTHAMTRITGALKNQFGYVNGFNKAAFHAKYPDLFEFSRMLIDINRFKKPRLYIMDGIVAMEGNGPKNGDPVKMNVLLLSEDGVAVDRVFSHLVDLNPDYVPTLRAARALEFGNTSLDDIELVGDDVSQFINKDFKVERIPAVGEAPGLGKLKYLRNLFTRRPIVNKEKCISCGICEKHCPQNPKAVKLSSKDNKPAYHYGRCIRCFCCQELCPNNAIEVKTPLLGKLFLYSD